MIRYKLSLVMISLLTLGSVKAQDLKGAWNGAYVSFSNVYRFTIYPSASGKLILDMTDKGIYDQEYEVMMDKDSIIFNHINSRGQLEEFRGRLSKGQIMGQYIVHNGYMEDFPATFLLVKSSASLVKNDYIADFELTTITNEAISSSELMGNYYILDFWATWCAPCVAKRPKLEKIKEHYGDKLEIVSISLDTDQSVVDNFRQKKFAMPWPHVLKSKMFDDPFVKQYIPTGLPYGYIVDPAGKIVAYGNELNAENLEKTIERVIR